MYYSFILSTMRSHDHQNRPSVLSVSMKQNVKQLKKSLRCIAVVLGQYCNIIVTTQY